MVEMGSGRWAPGDVVCRREVLGLGGPADDDQVVDASVERVWFGLPVHIVEDTGDVLVSFIAPGAEFGFVDGRWPTSDGRHPWQDRTRWEGHGCLMVQRADEEHAVWHFWGGPDRSFVCWYINFQARARRTTIGYDTQDFELDIVVFPDGRWLFKDRDVLDERVASGQLTRSVVDRVLRAGDQMAADLDAGRHWWDPRWATWTPPSEWHDASLNSGWSTAT